MRDKPDYFGTCLVIKVDDISFDSLQHLMSNSTWKFAISNPQKGDGINFSQFFIGIGQNQILIQRYSGDQAW